MARTLPLIISRNSTPKWKNGRKKRRKTSTEKWEVAFFESEENHPPPAINFEKCKKKFFGIITYCSSLSSLLFVFMVQLKVNGNKWVIFSLCFTCGSRCKKFHNHIGIVPDPFALVVQCFKYKHKLSKYSFWPNLLFQNFSFGKIWWIQNCKKWPYFDYAPIFRS